MAWTVCQTQNEGVVRDKRDAIYGSSDRLVVWGNGVFSGSETTAALEVTVEQIECVLAMPKTALGAGEFLGSTGVISSEKITIARLTGTSSALGFWYLYIGKPAISFDPYD